jgi:hypothetical protein
VAYITYETCQNCCFLYLLPFSVAPHSILGYSASNTAKPGVTA